MCIRDRPPACPRGAGRMRCSGHTTALGFPACPVTSPTPPGPFQPLAVTGPLLLVTRDGEFVTITMNWLERRNVLSLGLVRELARAFTSTAEGDSLGIVLAANGRSSAPVTTCASSPLWTCRGAVPGGAAVSHPYRPFGPGPHGRLTAMGRGKLRVYLGAAPGVGKTFAMLNEGRRRRERGTDAVVAFVETHSRARTAEAVAGLEILPRRTIAYRGTTFTEMDVDAVLARHPEVALIDELAHTNVPGSRHEKRWQDVEELLAAGIEVISTVNIQHLESLNDVVEKITGVPQRETIPDDVVRRADQIELVDMSPEALRRRMAHGNIYAAEKTDAALSNYFRVGNLTALRELALLWLADKVDEQLDRYRAEHGITATWEARERVVVALTGGPEGETLIRPAARIAARAHGGYLLAVHVTSSDGLAGTDPQALARQRVGPGQPVRARDVDGEQVPTVRPGGDAGGTPYQGLAFWAAGERDDDAFPGLPSRGDPVLGAVAVELLVHLVGEPEQRQLAQRGEVADPEVVAQRGVGLLGGVDVAVRHPPAQRLRRPGRRARRPVHDHADPHGSEGGGAGGAGRVQTRCAGPGPGLRTRAGQGRGGPAVRDGQGDGRQADAGPGKRRVGLSGRVPHRVDAATKAGLLDLLDEAVDAGWPLRRACHELELGEVRAHRWLARRARGQLADNDPGGSPMHGLLAEEAAAILDLFDEWGETDRSHRKLAHRGSYLGRCWVSPSSVRRVLFLADKHFRPLPRPGRSVRKLFPDWVTYTPNSIWIYDTTHFPAAGMAVLIIEDLVSRKWLTEVVSVEDETRPILLAVSDNGPQMTSGSTREFLALCAIAQHFGRPHTPTDQAWIESLNGHVKAEYPHLLAIRDPATLRAELAATRAKYNAVRLHAGVGYVTPNDEHEGRGEAIRKARQAGLEQARLHRLAWHRQHRQDPPIQEPHDVG